MRSEAEFLQNLEFLSNRDAILEAERLDLTREQTVMITKANVYSRIKKSLSPSGAKLFLAGMYLQGSLLLEAERAYFSVLEEVERLKDLEISEKLRKDSEMAEKAEKYLESLKTGEMAEKRAERLKRAENPEKVSESSKTPKIAENRAETPKIAENDPKKEGKSRARLLRGL
jgi:hypothetical protein